MANNVTDLTGQDRSVDSMIKQLDSLQKPDKTSHSGGGGDGGMIERVVKLEASVAHVQRDVTDLRNDMKDVRDRLKGLEVKVDHLPTKGFAVTALIILLGLIAALVGFQDQVQSFLGSSPVD